MSEEAAGVAVRLVERSDAGAWRRMRHALWPDGSEAEHGEEIERFLSGGAAEPLAVMIAHDPVEGAVGFAEISIRPHAEGCRTDRVAYLEGWYVSPGARRRGVGRLLVRAVERWARAHGCAELASDTNAGNAASLAAHVAAGFEDAGLIRCFRKELRRADESR
jgi:aminoglycoside 6'-N-acetyltransferase I